MAGLAAAAFAGVALVAAISAVWSDRGGMGIEGLMALYEFVKAGGTLIVEGATSTIFPEYNLTTGITVEEPDSLFARGSVYRGVVTDRRSPIGYGFNAQVPVYFSQAPVLAVQGAGGGFGGFGGGGNSQQQNREHPHRGQTISLTCYE